MVRTSGQMGVPVIVIDGQAIIGFDRARIQALVSRGQSQTPPRLGLQIADAAEHAQKHGDIPVFGALVGKVAPGSLGEKVGLNSGDIITEINARRVSNAADVERALEGLKTGNILMVIFLRGDETRKSEIVV
ncbi:MAG: hypothetical protein A2137_06495 [Chloroflexi bacterium RBG_16_58_8]|nr:MAG: hypothetical protein A2137_06495 [Chloroflexi bacterium RBG_16_58_8]